jgi:hypothetical protein
VKVVISVDMEGVTGITVEYTVAQPSEAMPVLVAQLLLALQVGQQGIQS